MKSKRAEGFGVEPRLRVRLGDEIALGPGKIELLQRIQETGSITQAARQMSMSYMRAWKLIQTMNHCFKEPVVVAIRGGQRRGGAALTRIGAKALSLYQRMQRDTLRACGNSAEQLRMLLRAGKYKARNQNGRTTRSSEYQARAGEVAAR
jgi:molybdate transport system regulatory protein